LFYIKKTNGYGSEELVEIFWPGAIVELDVIGVGVIFKIVALDDKGDGLCVEGEQNWAEDGPLRNTIADRDGLGG
jgi:hypothetical protein